MNAEFASTATAVEEVAAGVARSAAEVVSDPVRSARKQVRAFERKGTPVVRRINRRLNALLPDRLKVFGLDVNGKLPEKVAIKGLQLVKVQARRPDVVGDIAKRTLRIYGVAAHRGLLPGGREPELILFDLRRGERHRIEPDDALVEDRVRQASARIAAGDFSLGPEHEQRPCKLCAYRPICTDARKVL